MADRSGLNETPLRAMHEHACAVHIHTCAEGIHACAVHSVTDQQIGVSSRSRHRDEEIVNHTSEMKHHC